MASITFGKLHQLKGKLRKTINSYLSGERGKRLTATERKVSIKSAQTVLKNLPKLQANKAVQITNNTRITLTAKQKSLVTSALRGEYKPSQQRLVSSRNISKLNAARVDKELRRIRDVVRGARTKGYTPRLNKGDAQLLVKRYNSLKKQRQSTPGFIYKIKDIKTKKVYIGQTVQGVQRRFLQHARLEGTRIDKALDLSNMSRFKVTTIAKTSNRAKLDALEAKFIAKYKSNNPKFGYNLNKGVTNTVNRLITQNNKKITNTPTRLRVIKRKS